MSSLSVRCICINDKEKPEKIPLSMWVKEGEEYHITHIFIMKNQNDIKGCELKEIDLRCPPYNCFALSRFGIPIEEMPKLIDMMKYCGKINDIPDINIDKLIEKIKPLEV